MTNSQNLSQNNSSILNDIQGLQEMEQNLFVTLETNPHLTPEQQTNMISKMNSLSNMRINLYKTLSGVNNYFKNALETSTGTLKEQTIAIGIVESELNQAKTRLQMLENNRNEKIRLVEINDYYGEKYSEHAEFMQILIFTLIPIIILAVLNKKGLIPNTIYYILVGMVALVGTLLGWNKFFSIISRDNMNYQEYQWYFDPNSAPQPSTSSTDASGSSSDPWMTPTSACVGAACCSSSETYDASTNLCVSTTTNTNTNKNKNTTTESFVTESMIQNVLTKTQQNKYKPDVNMNSQYQGVSSKSFIYK
jgi:hypothetical protein